MRHEPPQSSPVVGPAPRRRRAVLRRFIATFLLLAVALVLVLVLFAIDQARRTRAGVEMEELDRVRLLRETVVRDFRAMISDVGLLAEDRALVEYLDAASGTAAPHLDVLSQRLASFARQRGIYDQVRYIDSAGREIVRVDHDAAEVRVVPRDELSDKSSRYYFVASRGLQHGDVFMSPFDLNVERGRIEQPWEPTIRFATAVFDSAGDARGIVVLNYHGNLILDEIERLSANAAGRTLLLNADGYFLRGLSREDEWAFMDPARNDDTFASRFPDAWEAVSSSDMGRAWSPAGLFTYITFTPVPVFPARRWTIVSYVSAAQFAEGERKLRNDVVVLALPLLAGAGGAAWLLARSLTDREEAQRRVLESARLAAVGEAMTGLAHESRNALQRSQACLEMLASRSRDRPESVELITKLQRAQDDLYRLYESVRGYAAPLVVRREPYDMRRIVRECWDDLNPGERGDIPIAEEGDVDATAVVDAFAMRQVFRNVLENAVIAMREVASGQPVSPVSVRYEAGTHDGRPALAVRVRDAGPGLEPDAAAHIFEPFFTTRTRGTGLGLAIARRIVEAHEGSITVGAVAPGLEIVIMIPRESS